VPLRVGASKADCLCCMKIPSNACCACCNLRPDGKTRMATFMGDTLGGDVHKLRIQFTHSARKRLVSTLETEMCGQISK
jgi:hypothetical protein